MRVWSRCLVRGFAAATICAVSVLKAQAQVDANIQSRVQSYTIPLTMGIGETQFGLIPAPVEARKLVPGGNPLNLNTKGVGACVQNTALVVVLMRSSMRRKAPGPRIKKYLDSIIKEYPGLNPNKITEAVAAKIMIKFFEKDSEARADVANAINYYLHPTTEAEAREKAAFPPLTIGYCGAKTTVKFSAPLNPTDETNALKSSLNHNSSPSTSWGYGGNVQAVIPMATTLTSGDTKIKTFDAIGLSAQSQSVRYNQEPSKSFDAVITQFAYQRFLSASGYWSPGVKAGPIDATTPLSAIPPANMITATTVAFGFQNQTVFTTPFHSETADLFTPQATLNVQNFDLSGHGLACQSSSSDPRKDGFCWFADMALTPGESLSDVPSQQNANITASLSPGVRINNTDLKLTVPTTVTLREYQHVAGGRQDTLVQIGPVLTYSPAPIIGNSNEIYAVTFSMSATYNQNYSTVSADAWHGYVGMATLTVALQPSPKPN
jgi:hypothetical protein